MTMMARRVLFSVLPRTRCCMGRVELITANDYCGNDLADGHSESSQVCPQKIAFLSVAILIFLVLCLTIPSYPLLRYSYTSTRVLTENHVVPTPICDINSMNVLDICADLRRFPLGPRTVPSIRSSQRVFLKVRKPCLSAWQV